MGKALTRLCEAALSVGEVVGGEGVGAGVCGGGGGGPAVTWGAINAIFNCQLVVINGNLTAQSHVTDVLQPTCSNLWLSVADLTDWFLNTTQCQSHSSVLASDWSHCDVLAIPTSQ